MYNANRKHVMPIYKLQISTNCESANYKSQTANMDNKNDFATIIYPDLSYKITGILFTVHNEIGRFANEKQYSDAVELHLKGSDILFEREKILPPSFQSESEGRNKVDFLIDDKIVLEFKTKRFLTREDYYQVRRYLQSLNKKLGILVNFQQKYIRPQRILNSLAKD